MQILIKNKIALLLISITILCAVAFYPKFYTSNDERNYIQNAHYIQDGINITQNDSNIDCSGSGNEAYGFMNDSGCVSKYNLGTSLLLYPFLLISWEFVFIASLVALLATAVLFHKILIAEQLNTMWLTLLLLHPILSYYSLKVFSEIFSMIFLLGIVYILFYQKKSNLSYLLSGALGGILVLIKYSNIFLLIATLFYKVYKDYKENNSFFIFHSSFLILGATPFALLFLYINNLLYGSMLSSGYGLANESFFFSPQSILNQWPWILLIFIIIYPLQLLALKDETTKIGYLPLILFTTSFLLFGSFPYFSFESGIQNLILGARLFVPIIPILLIPYIKSISSFNILKNKILLVIIFLILLTGKIFISYELQQRTSELKTESDFFYDSLNDGETAEGSYILINDAFGKKLYTSDVVPWVPPGDRSDVYINE